MFRIPHLSPPGQNLPDIDLVRAAVDHIAVDEIFINDIDGNILYANNSACSALGYTIDELTGMNIRDLNPSLTAAQIRESFIKSRKKGMQIIESLHRRKDGSSFPVEISFNVANIAGVEVSCSIVRDITDRRKIEKETEQLRFAVDNATDAVYIFDKHGNLRFANRSAEKELGYTAEELRGMSIRDIDPLLNASEERLALAEQRWKEAVAGDSVIFESVHQRKDGSTFPVEGTHCAFSMGGEELGISFVRNITERKETLRKNEQLQFAIDNATDAIYLCNKDGEFYYVNETEKERHDDTGGDKHATHGTRRECICMLLRPRYHRAQTGHADHGGIPLRHR
ncbi:MAG: PAS domain S-box protein [Gammaproteobacteria bacterium]